ncbi:Transmembrane protein 65 [Aphelenchoides avenae]|nr:Transmembrane protein 65 [Aphelenchus avenae]
MTGTAARLVMGLSRCAERSSRICWSRWSLDGRAVQPSLLRRSLYTSTPATSTSGVINHVDHVRIDSSESATALVNHLQRKERELLLAALNEKSSQEDVADGSDQPSVAQLKQLFAYNAIPFIGFGILDNMIMILAGEYIDQSLGALLAISTMAAAALGNIISDVAGVGLAHYVEKLAGKLGIRHPVLTAAQLESSRARVTVNLARAFGLVIGCLIGMFPLLFF